MKQSVGLKSLFFNHFLLLKKPQTKHNPLDYKNYADPLARMWMNHIQGEQFLKQTNGQKIVASHSFCHQRCHAAPCFAPSGVGEGSTAIPPSSALGSAPRPHLSHTQHASVRQHQAHGAVTDTVFELQVCALAGSTRELLLLLTQSRHRGFHGWVEGRKGSCQLFLGVFTAHMAQIHTLGCHILLSPLLP